MIMEKNEIEKNEELSAKVNEEVDKINANSDNAQIKNIDFTAVSEALLREFADALIALREVKEEIEQRIIEAITKNEEVKKKLEALEKDGFISIDKDQAKRFEESIKTYLGLLYSISVELTQEIDFFKPYFVTPQPATVPVPIAVTTDAGTFISMSIDGIKRHAKTVRKGMIVSYSRYGHSLDSQMKQLTLLESQKQK